MRDRVPANHYKDANEYPTPQNEQEGEHGVGTFHRGWIVERGCCKGGIVKSWGSVISDLVLKAKRLYVGNHGLLNQILQPVWHG